MELIHVHDRGLAEAFLQSGACAPCVDNKAEKDNMVSKVIKCSRDIHEKLDRLSGKNHHSLAMAARAAAPCCQAP